MVILNSNLMCLQVVIMFLGCVIREAYTDVLPSILWATYDPFFRRLGDSPRTVFNKDKITFICPNIVFYPGQSEDEYNRDVLYANIYMVDKQGYDTCNATGGFKLKICNNPSVVESYNVIILTKDQLPSNNLPAFQLGQTHYFIDTSDGSKQNVTSLNGGKCRTHNMKMKMYVCNDKSDKSCPHGINVTNGGWSPWGTCSQSGKQTRECNNPTPSNGGMSCQGNNTQSCSLPTPCILASSTIKPVDNNDTSTPKKEQSTNSTNNNNTATPKNEKRTSTTSGLNTLTVGEAVAIFLSVLVFGIICGILLGIFLARTKLKNTQFKNVMRKKGNKTVDPYCRDSVVSTARMRPFSTISNDTTLTGVPNFSSYNDIHCI